MITKIIYTTDKRTDNVTIPDWVGKLMDIKLEKSLAEYNANLEYLKVNSPEKSTYTWKDQKGILRDIVVKNKIK